MSEEEIKAIIGELKENENTVYALTERAKQYMAESDFAAAESLWRKLSEKVENDIFYKQQRALCKYKSEKPNANIACTEAIKIIGSIKNQLDPETLGIEGAIYKKLWRLTQYNDCLEKATECYKKSWELYHDYYPGENYAVCMIDKSQQEKDPNEKIHHIVEAKHTFNTIIENLEALLKKPEIDALMWKYATLSNCYYGIKEEENAAKYESMFRGMNPEGWEIESFSETKEKLQKWISDGII